ncbi:MAG: hypothetical protein JSV39_00075, partial [Candidatus Aenigmatarchaeota archaeon]
MGYSGRLLGQQLTQNLYTDDVGLLSRPNNTNRPGKTFYIQPSENDSGLLIPSTVIYGPDGNPLSVSKKHGHDYVNNGKVTTDGKVNVEWTDDFQKNLSNVGQAIEVARRLNPNGRITRSKNYQEQIPPETVPASYLKTNHSRPYAHAQPETTQNMKNPGPISKLVKNIGGKLGDKIYNTVSIVGPKLGKNFYKFAFAGSVLGMLTFFFGCGKNNPISNPDPQDPQPQPSPTTAYINVNAVEQHGGEPISEVIAQLLQNGNTVVEGTLSDGYVQLILTKNLTPNSSGQY